MKLVYSSDDRLLPANPSGRGWAGPVVYGLVLPFTLIAVGFSGWYMVTGENPRDLAEMLLRGPHISLPMPARPRPEKPPEAPSPPPLTLSPIASQPPAAPSAAPPVAPPAPPTPEPKTAPDLPPPAEKPAVPQVSLPVVPPPAIASNETAKPAAPPPIAVPPAPSFVPPPPPPPLAEPAIPPGGDSLAPPSFAQLPSLPGVPTPLAPAPLPDLLRQTASGQLPIVVDGREAWKIYARPISVAQSKPGPKIAVLVTGLGLSQEATATAIAKLPPDVSLSFSPYGSGLNEWIRKARASGHEALLDLPLEPVNFPQHDAGPLAVLASHSPGEAIGRLDGVLGKATAYVGLAAPLHSPVTATESWASILQEVKDRGLLLVGDGLVGIEDRAMPAAGAVTMVVDETPFRTAVDAKLARVLMAAQRDGSAILSLSARPVSFERLLAFLASLPEKGVTLVPVSAVVRPEP